MSAGASPALVRRRLRQTGVLSRLAQLRRDLALGALSAARAALAEAAAARDAAEAQARLLSEEQAARRVALRSPMLGNAQLRGAVESVLNTFAADRAREAAAQQDAADAQVMLDAARADVETARQTLAAAERLIDKRARMRAPLLEARARAQERAEEREAEERRSLAQGSALAGPGMTGQGAQA
ncbi:hypothetical protein [Paracoccus contaminans]|uniref:Flagellar FliJ protein n=1 Tax=Paracoccus contaminans TaxID=1945662 RepID=A0A1W6D019_9RHOB|nr:hypothetical protein [Paracoccus contaminans]ARJ70450.1 hypothetical protein B0A89_13195 [Paracoccus contaminans]